VNEPSADTPEPLRREARRQLDVLTRGAVEVLQADELYRRLVESLTSGRPLTVKLGLDPTAPDIHLGHVLVLDKLRQFQDLGHRVVLIIGDFTARIGDPSGRNSARPPLSEERVAAFGRTYLEQATRVLDPGTLTLSHNHEWLSALGLPDLMGLMSRVTLARILEREDFHQRMIQHQPLHMHELLYPLMQAYDSVAIEADVELGGMDQKFNLMTARQIQEASGQRPEVAILMPMLVGLDGVKKMSKSLGNYVGITDPPADMYGKTMSVPDDLVEEWGRRVLGWPEGSVGARMQAGEHPRDVKASLAHGLVERFWGRADADLAAESFAQTFREGRIPSDAPTVSLPEGGGPEGWPAVDVVAALPGVGSRSEARRLLTQGGVTVDGARVEVDAAVRLAPGSWVRLGRRRFFRYQ
jgi:tyrosyl-tRNA synthetase